jgi:hypothetical protein
MKRCTWCGKEYVDEADACTIDGHPLEAIAAPVSGIHDEGVQEDSSVKRPKGIWIVTIWMAFTAGLIPIWAALYLYFGVPEEERMISGLGVVISVSMALSMIISSACAWRGFAWARFALIGLAINHYGWIGRNLFGLWQSGAVAESGRMLVWARLARAVISLTIVVLYLLLNKKAKDFFKNYRQAGKLSAAADAKNGYCLNKD